MRVDDRALDPDLSGDEQVGAERDAALGRRQAEQAERTAAPQPAGRLLDGRAEAAAVDDHVHAFGGHLIVGQRRELGGQLGGSGGPVAQPQAVDEAAPRRPRLADGDVGDAAVVQQTGGQQADDAGPDLILNFDNGDSLTLIGLSSTAGLLADIGLF